MFSSQVFESIEGCVTFHLPQCYIRSHHTFDHTSSVFQTPKASMRSMFPFTIPGLGPAER